MTISPVHIRHVYLLPRIEKHKGSKGADLFIGGKKYFIMSTHTAFSVISSLLLHEANKERQVMKEKKLRNMLVNAAELKLKEALINLDYEYTIRFNDKSFTFRVFQNSPKPLMINICYDHFERDINKLQLICVNQ